MNIVVNYGLSMRNDEMFIGGDSETVIVLNNATKCAAQKHIFLNSRFLQEVRCSQFVPSSISYGFLMFTISPQNC